MLATAGRRPVSLGTLSDVVSAGTKLIVSSARTAGRSVRQTHEYRNVTSQYFVFTAF